MNEIELEFTKLVREYRKTIYTVCYFFSPIRGPGPSDRFRPQDTAIDEVGNLLRPQHLQLDERDDARMRQPMFEVL